MNVDTTPIVALVPLQHHSQRVPGKNYLLLAGEPLYHNILRSLLAYPEIGQVIVDTDSPIIMEGMGRYFPVVRIIERPPHLKANTISISDILLYDSSQVTSDFYLPTNCTKPLLGPGTISRAINAFLRIIFPTILFSLSSGLRRAFTMRRSWRSTTILGS